jgi:hypothetical protein
MYCLIHNRAIRNPGWQVHSGESSFGYHHQTPGLTQPKYYPPKGNHYHRDVTLPLLGAVLPRGRNLITDSNSRSIRVLDSALSLRETLFALSSFILTMRSSRVSVDRGLGSATAS